MASWNKKKTAGAALAGDVKDVAQGGKGFRLIDQESFFPRHDDGLKKINDTRPSAVVTEVLKFDSNNPGPGENSRSLPRAQCQGVKHRL